ncbi:unnamed protein product [Cunninghamella echinulata]
MDIYGYKKQAYKSGLANQDNNNVALNSSYLTPHTSLYPVIDNSNNNKKNKINYKLGSFIQQQQQQQQYRITEGSIIQKQQYLSTNGKENTIPKQQRYTQDTPYYSKVIEPTIHQQQQRPMTSPLTSSSYSSINSISPENDISITNTGFQSWSQYKKKVNKTIPSTSSCSSPPYRYLSCMTTQLVHTYEKRNPKYHYQQYKNPKRILTKPSKPAKNDGYDNEDHDYILFVNDILGEDHHHRYRVIDLLGQGTFGQVVKCEHTTTGKLYSVKVIKNRPAFRSQSCMEVEILKQLNQKMDAKNQHHILRLEHTFNHKNHLCLVFELLSFNLYELVKQNGYKGLSIHLVRNITKQLLETLDFLNDVNIIHCDLKPENILLESVNSPKIKVIDFGSACHKASTVFTYIQSRFYRSPEILIQMQYTNAIDMWSLGCIVAELYLGMPLFPGSSEFDQLSRIMNMLGQLSDDMLHRGGKTTLFFDQESISGTNTYKRKSIEKYNKENKKMELPSKRYFKYDTLDDIIMKSNSSWNNLPESKIDKRAIQYDKQMRQWLLEFLYKTLDLNPLTRWSPQEALKHPFITGKDNLKKRSTQLFNEPLQAFSTRINQQYQQNQPHNLNNIQPTSRNEHQHQQQQYYVPSEINNPSSSSSTSLIHHHDNNNNNNNNNNNKSRHRAKSLHFATVPQHLKQLTTEIQISTKEGLLPQPQQKQQQKQQQHEVISVKKNEAPTIAERRALRSKQTRSMYDTIGILPTTKAATMNNNDNKKNHHHHPHHQASEDSVLYTSLPPTTIV